MRHLQKSLSFFLCIVLCLSLFPAAGFAEGGEAAAGEITVGEQVPAEEPEEAADADVVEEEEGAADAETEQVVPEEPEDVLIEDDADKAISAEAEEPEEDAERKTGSTEQVEGFVRRGYSLMLGRDADADGLRYYVDLLTSGRLSGAQMVSNFMNSPEFSDKKVSNEEAVTILYRVMMNREPDPDGLAYHKANLDRGLSYNCVINNFSGSPEFGDICAESGITPGTVALEWRDQNPLVTDFVNRNYLYALERKGEGDGLNYYCEILLNRSLTPQQVAHGFVFSPECINRGLNDRAFIEMLYHLYMGREADEGGMNYYLDALANGVTREQVEAGFAYSKEFNLIVEGYGFIDEYIVLNGKKYIAVYYGQQDISSWSECVYRDFWHLENAYDDFKNARLFGDVLPANDYIMPIEIGQVYVVDYYMKDGRAFREVMRCDGNLFDGQLCTNAVAVDVSIYTETISIGGKNYTASYFGKWGSPPNSPYANRSFWRLENAYNDFKDNRYAGESLYERNYPMAIEAGQIYIIDYTLRNGGRERKIMRNDGIIQEGQQQTYAIIVE